MIAVAVVAVARCCSCSGKATAVVAVYMYNGIAVRCNGSRIAALVGNHSSFDTGGDAIGVILTKYQLAQADDNGGGAG